MAKAGTGVIITGDKALDKILAGLPLRVQKSVFRKAIRPAAREIVLPAAKTNAPVDQITCAKAWDVFLEQLWFMSALSMPRIIRMASGEAQTPEQHAKACREVTRKIYNDSPGGVGAKQDNDGECDLRPGIALATLWNHMSRRDTFKRVGDRHSNNNDPLNSVIQSKLALISSLSSTVSSIDDKFKISSTVETTSNSLGGRVLSAAAGVISPLGKGLYDVTVEQAPAVDRKSVV